MSYEVYDLSRGLGLFFFPKFFLLLPSPSSDHFFCFFSLLSVVHSVLSEFAFRWYVAEIFKFPKYLCFVLLFF